MPWIIDYQLVLEQMREQRFKCLYYNSGAFALPAEAKALSIGWIGPPDDSLLPAARAIARSAPPPFEANLAELTTRAWQQLLPGRAWAMPKSHWAYELEFGSREWMPALLENIEIDPGLLLGRNNAAAIEFGVGESHRFKHFVERLLQMLLGSDFLLAFPRRDTICTIHSHKQIWWTTGDSVVAAGLNELLPLLPAPEHLGED